jgi:cytochrome c553
MPLSCRGALGLLLLTLTLGSGTAAAAAAAAAAASPAAAATAGNAARGEQLSYTCLGCHGIETYKNVYPTYSVPALVGQHPTYIVAALKEYRSGERSHGTMHVQAASLSDQDIEDIAVYFAGPELKPTTATVGTPPAKVAQLCVACHGKDGVGITGDYPTLAGQHADYLARALEEYKSGDRKNAVMPSFMTSVTDAEIAEIAHYYSQQTPPLRTEPRRLTILSAQ